MQEPRPPSPPAIGPKGKPRRPHHKSRNGCAQCKQRKVKCGEETPVCKKCESYGSTCSFLQTHPLKRPQPPTQPTRFTDIGASNPGKATVQFMLSSDPSSVSSSSNPSIADSIQINPSPLQFTILDLELLHHYTLESVNYYVESQTFIELFRTTVIKLGFKHPFLMHQILAMGALHLAHVHPEKREFYLRAADSHAVRALALFQPQVTNVTDENCDACFVFSTTIFTHAWAAQELDKPSTLFFPTNGPITPEEASHPAIQWVKLHRGTNIILRYHYLKLIHGPLVILFEDWTRLDPHREDPIHDPAEKARLEDLPHAWNNSTTLTEPDKGALDDAHFRLRRVVSMLVVNPEMNTLSRVMSWFSMISDEYLRLLEAKTPEALVVSIYYCTLLKKLDHMWWMKGKAENLLNTLLDALGPGWERWTKWPMEYVLGPPILQTLPHR